MTFRRVVAERECLQSIDRSDVKRDAIQEKLLQDSLEQKHLINDDWTGLWPLKTLD